MSRDRYPMTSYLQIKCVCIVFSVYLTISDASSSSNDSGGQPLFLTSMIKAGDIKKARSLSKVKPLKGDVTSYAGFFTVNETYNSNMFFWFFPATQNETVAPVILWLMGGPGDSSLISLFKENGPYQIKEDLTLELRGSSWTKDHSVIYIDNPVGAGFSFTEDERGYSTNEVEVGANLYSALVQFFTLFPQYQSNDFFIAGESYAGKFVTAISYNIHVNNPSGHVKINLQGLAIGNGAIDPSNMTDFTEYYYQLGLIDQDGRNLFNKKVDELLRLIEQKEWIHAFFLYDSVVLGYVSNSTLLFNLTGYKFIFNYLYNYDYRDFDIVSRFFSVPGNQRNLHVGSSTFNGTSNLISRSLIQDFLQDVEPWFKELLDEYRVLLYNGQLDLLIPYRLTEQLVSALSWGGQAEYSAVRRRPWYVGQQLAGSWWQGGGLTRILVRDAGHSAPLDQPRWCQDMIYRFTRDLPFN